MPLIKQDTSGFVLTALLNALRYSPRFSGLGMTTSAPSGFSRGGPSMYGMRKHAGEVRRIKKHQRYRKHMKSLRK